MALTQLTKVDGRGINTTSDYRVGILTAVKFVGPFDGTGGNFAGVVTATDGVFSGNVTIGGTLTYEDVTNIDSVGIITAQKDIHVGAGVSAVGVITGRYLNPSSVSTQNVIIGWEQSTRNVTGSWNVLIGRRAGESLTSAGSAVCIGANAGQLLGGTSGIFIGGQAGSKTTGSANLFIGNNAGQQTTSAGSCTIIGHLAGIDNQGNNNTILGYYAGRGNSGVTDGAQNTFIGAASGFKIQGGDDNTGVGYYTLRELLGGNKNVAIGRQAGDALVSGNNNIIIGYQADASTTTTSNEITLGDGNINHLRIPGIGVSFNNTGGTQLGIITATELDISGDIDVDGHTNLDNVSIAGVTTIAQDIDVDGHTYLDNVSVAGITTHNEDVRFITANGGNILIDKSDNSIRLGQSVGLFYGTNKMWMQHNGSTGYLHNVTGSLYIRNEDSSGDIYIQGKSGENSIICNYDGNVQLYNDGTIRFNTTSTGVTVHGSADPDLKIRQGASSSSGSGFLAYENVDGNGIPRSIAKIQGKTTGNGGYGELNFQTAFNNTLSTRWTIDNTGHLLPGAVGSYNIGSTGAEIGNVFLADSKKVFLGSDQDASIYHDGTHGYLTNNTGNLFITNTGSSYSYIDSNYFRIRNSSGSHMLEVNSAGANQGVRIFHTAGASGGGVFKTTSTGIEVTGEVAASQDYPDFKPSLDLNFAATKKLDPRIKFARQGVASYYDALGNVKFAADNEPRFDHDPDTGECKGLLIEQDSINLIAGSADEGSDTRSVYSTLGNGFAINELVSDVIRPTGTPGLVRRVKSHASSNSGGRWGGYSGSGGSPYAGSFWARSVTGTSQVGIDVNDTGYNVTTLTTKWVRVEAVGTTGNNYDFMDITLPNTSDDIYIWGMQLEQNEYASSYIRNGKNSTQAYRGADTAYIDGESFDEFYNQSEGTMVSSHSLLPNVSATQNCYTYQVAPDTGTSEAPFRLIDRNGAYGNSLVATSVSSSSSVAFFRASGNPVTPANKKMKIAFAIKTNDFAASFNGGTTLTDTAGTFSQNNDHISIGYYKPSPQAYLNGHIQRLTYYPKRLSNTQLQNLSS